MRVVHFRDKISDGELQAVRDAAQRFIWGRETKFRAEVRRMFATWGMIRSPSFKNGGAKGM